MEGEPMAERKVIVTIAPTGGMANKEQKINAKLPDAAKSHRRTFVAPPDHHSV